MAGHTLPVSERAIRAALLVIGVLLILRDPVAAPSRFRSFAHVTNSPVDAFRFRATVGLDRTALCEWQDAISFVGLLMLQCIVFMTGSGRGFRDS